MCVYTQRQKYVFLTDLWGCTNTGFCFINVIVETGAHMWASQLSINECRDALKHCVLTAPPLIMRRKSTPACHHQGSPSASEQLSLCITVSTAAAISGARTCTCEPSPWCCLGGCLNRVARCILSDPIASGQLQVQVWMPAWGQVLDPITQTAVQRRSGAAGDRIL